ncbi:MAG: deoxyribonuclease IV [Elusimicrobiota bacterium]
MIFGVHCDVRGGYVPALRHAESLGCGAMQMLSYRRHHEPVPDELAGFRAAFSESALSRLVLHVRYLPSLGAEDAGRRRRSVDLLAREVRLARSLGGDWLVMHMGAYSSGSSLVRGTRLFAEGVRAALDEAGAEVPLAVENVPGGGRRMGGSLEELAALLEALDRLSVRAHVCLDTAHAWAYGYEIDGREGMWRFLGKLHRLIGAERVSVFHLSDTRVPLGAHREHHWHLGEGFLGTECLASLFEREEFRTAVGILETPAGAGLDAANLKRAHSLL